MPELLVGRTPTPTLRFEDTHHAPDAGLEALAIQKDGLNAMNRVRAKYATGAQMTASEMLTLCNAFIQVSGVSGEGNIANITTSIRLPESISPFQSAEGIGRRIAGIDAQVAPFGRKVLFMVESSKVDPDLMLQRLAAAPRITNSEFFPEDEARVLNEIQDDRVQEFSLEQGGIFKGILEGSANPLRRAFQQDGKRSFVWGVKREGLIGITPDGREQSLFELENKDSTDEDTREMLKAEREWLDGTEKGSNRFVIKVCFDEYVVPCCIASTAAQQEIKSIHESNNIINLDAKAAQRSNLDMERSDNQRVSVVGGGASSGRYDSENCSTCGENKEGEPGCKCSLNP